MRTRLDSINKLKIGYIKKYQEKNTLILTGGSGKTIIKK